MSGLTPEEEKRKKAVFDAMSARSRKRVLDKEGYEKWDPFQMPKDPIDIRMDQHRETALSLMRRFLQTCPEDYSKAYGQGAWEICMGITGGDDRWRGIYDFSCWYRDRLKNGGL